jgi:hypothetical protein
MCAVALVLAVPDLARAADPVVTYVAPELYPSRIKALNFGPRADGPAATPQRLEAGHAVTVKSWSVALKANKMAEYFLRKPYGPHPSWAVRVRAGCTAVGETTSSGCSLILARKGGIPDCALMVLDPLAGKRKRIVIDCPESVEFADKG